jgi:hypothetical protein
MTDYPAFVAARFTKRHTGADGLLHAAVGIVGELVELHDASCRTNVIEELGDIEFYLEAARQMCPPVPYDDIPSKTGTIYGKLMLCAGWLLDEAKRWWVYGKAPDLKSCAEMVEHLSGLLLGYYDLIGTTRADVIAANVAKLRKRYPDGYTDALAVARLDKA